MLNASGNLTGVCATASTECYALDGTSVTVSATSALGRFLAYQPFYDGGVLQSYVVGKTQVYTFKDDLDAAPPYAIKQSRISCYDFATGDFCFRDTSKLSTAPDIVTDPAAFYAVTEDPERPGCVWALGDKSRAAVWEAATGGPCVQRTVTYAVDTIPVNYYGFDKTINGDVEYRKVVIHGLDSSFVDSTNGVRVTVAAVDEAGGTKTLVDNVQLAAPSAGGDYVLNLDQYATGTTALTPPLKYKNYPRLRTTITVYRAIGNPSWPTGVISDVIWSGPPVQFSVQTTAPTNTTSSCNGESFVQSGIFVANTTNGTVTTSTRAVSNALLENLASSSTGPVMLTSSYLGYERTNPQSWEGTPTIAMYTMYDSNVFTGTRPITGTALTTQRCWALDLSSGETGIGNATHNPIGQVVDLLSIESPRGSTTGSGATAVHSCQPGRSWINRLNALTGLPTGFDTNADGFINGTEAAIGAVSVDRSTGQIINNGRNLTAGTGGSVGPTGPGSVSITPPNVGRIWWREL
ncbi:MAG: hypothetical protein KKC79_03365 [Gammaproteobacteria bacterium]|nr:hypothetical protein [Gammaproteobacteria bacterium]MBU1443468.1 hypothetical protein [Gammaproteobacteria bacterium]MBU2407669.1 hypothetical protein [Gammaproteobacteria bacterium]